MLNMMQPFGSYLRYILRLHLHVSILFASVCMYVALISKFKLCVVPSFRFGKPKRRHYSYTIRWNQCNIFHPFWVFSYVFISIFMYFLFSWACAFVSLPHSDLRPVQKQISNSLFLRNEADFPNATRLCFSRISRSSCFSWQLSTRWALVRQSNQDPSKAAGVGRTRGGFWRIVTQRSWKRFIGCLAVINTPTQSDASGRPHRDLVWNWLLVHW